MGAHRAAGVLLLSFCTANAWFSGVARSEELHKLRQADHRKNHDGLLVGALMPTPPNLRSAAMMPLARRASVAPYIPLTPPAVVKSLSPWHLSPLTQARGMLLACAATWATYPVIMRALYAAPGPTLNAAPTFVVALRFLATAVMQALVQGILKHRRKSHAAPSDAGATEAGTPGGGVSSSIGGGGIAHAPRSQTLVMASAVPADEARSIQRRMRGAAVELGVIGLCGNFLSVSGIAHLPAMLAEVFLGTVHIFVPLCSVALGGAAAVGARTWAACALSFAAVCVAGLGGAVASGGLSSAAAAIGGASASYIGGIFSMIGAALLYSLARVRTSHHLRSGLDAQALNRRRYQAISGLAVAALLVDALVRPLGVSRLMLGSLHLISPMQWLLLAASCTLSGVLGSSLQFEGQKVVPAASAQPLFALQPLFACLWCSLFLDEPVAPAMLVGGGMMVGGALLAAKDQERAVATSA